MPCIVTNRQTDEVVRKVLSAEGYKLSHTRSCGETGPDLVAQKGSDKIFVEAIGYKSSPPARSKDFFESFFRAISRIKQEEPGKCAIALPQEFQRGLPARAHQYGASWNRIGLAFPELELWIVNTETGTCKRTHWNDWLTEEVYG